MESLFHLFANNYLATIISSAAIMFFVSRAFLNFSTKIANPIAPITRSVSSTSTSASSTKTIASATAATKPKKRKMIAKAQTVELEKPPFLMVASIGNPENKYKGTRHSVGHYILHKCCLRKGFQPSMTYGANFYANPENDNVVFYENQGYMNLSGKPLSKAWNKIRSAKADEYTPILVVLHDELDLALGKIKIRKRGASHNGHNGLKSIQAVIGKTSYIAIQIGIGRNYAGDHKINPNVVSDYVLSKFTRDEFSVLDEEVVPKLINAVDQMQQGKHLDL